MAVAEDTFLVAYSDPCSAISVVILNELSIHVNREKAKGVKYEQEKIHIFSCSY